MIPQKRFQNRKWLLAFTSLSEAASYLQLPHWDTVLSFPGKSTQSSFFRSLQPKFAYHYNIEFVLGLI